MTDKEKSKSLNISSIADTVTKDIEREDVTPEAESLAAENAAELQGGGAKITDHQGTIFNPALHATDKDGQPKYTKAGRFAKKRGVKPNQTNAPKQFDKKGAQIGSYEAGVAATALTVQTGVAFFGDEWQPQVKDEINESDMLIAAYQRYFDARGVIDIPPGWALVIALSSYAGPRLTQPKTKSRMQKIKEWGASKFMNWRVKRNGSFLNFRQNGQRKDDTIKKDSGKAESQRDADIRS